MFSCFSAGSREGSVACSRAPLPLLAQFAKRQGFPMVFKVFQGWRPHPGWALQDGPRAPERPLAAGKGCDNVNRFTLSRSFACFSNAFPLFPAGQALSPGLPPGMRFSQFHLLVARRAALWAPCDTVCALQVGCAPAILLDSLISIFTRIRDWFT